MRGRTSPIFHKRSSDCARPGVWGRRRRDKAGNAAVILPSFASPLSAPFSDSVPVPSVLWSVVRMPQNQDERLDETTALLPAKEPKPVTPLPRLQIGILLLLQLAEPITSQCIYPFINQVCIILDS